MQVVLYRQCCSPGEVVMGDQDDGAALLSHFGHWVEPEGHHDKGPRPQLRGLPLTPLLYAQVVKSYRHRHLVGFKHAVDAFWGHCYTTPHRSLMPHYTREKCYGPARWQSCTDQRWRAGTGRH